MTDAPHYFMDPLGASVPDAPTRLVGRTDELARVRELLADTGCVQIVGPPGIGKTRLAIEVARLESEHRDVFWIWLQRIDFSLPVSAFVGRTMGLTSRTMRPADLADALSHRDGQTLLVLDNAEHLVDGARRLVEALGPLPRVDVVLTSRSRIEGATVELSGLPEEQGVELMDDLRDATSEGGEREALSGFVERVGGLPLALRLGVARLDVLTPRQLAEGVGAGIEDALADSVSRSWDRLDELDRAVMSALSVFRGGAEPLVVTEVSELLADDVVGALKRLRHGSLVESEVVDERRRFWLLPSVREFVAATTDVDELEDRHAAWYANRARDVAQEERALSDGSLSRELDRERLNFHSAARWALSSDRVDEAADASMALAVASRLSGFADDFLEIGKQLWTRRDAIEDLAFFSEYCRVLIDSDRLSLAETVAAHLEERAISPQEQTASKRALARLAYRRGEVERAAEFAEEAVTAARAHGDPYDVAVARREWAAIASATANPQGVTSALKDAGQTFRELGARRDEAMCDYLLAWAWSSLEEPDEFRLAAERALSGAREVADRRLSLEAQWLRGVAHHEVGDLDVARDVLEQALTESKRAGVAEQIRCAAEVLLNVYVEMDEHQLAREMLAIQGRHARGSTDPIVRFWHHALHGELLAHEGELEEAASELDAALSSHVGHWNAGLIVGVNCHRAIVGFILGEEEAAVEALERARRVAEERRRETLLQRCTIAATAAACAATDAVTAGTALELLAAFRRGDDAFDRRSSQCRLQAKLIERNLERWRGLLEHLTQAPDQWLLSFDGDWFRTPDGTWVSLRSSERRRDMLACLVSHEVADVDTIIADVWTGQRLTPSSARNRVRTTISMLRSDGLGDLVTHVDDGYRLDPARHSVWRPDN